MGAGSTMLGLKRQDKIPVKGRGRKGGFEKGTVFSHFSLC